MRSSFKVAGILIGAVIILIAATPRVIRQFTNIGVDSTARFDSIGTGFPYKEAGRTYVASNGVGTVYAYYSDGSRHNLDSTGAGSVTVVSHTPVYKRTSLPTVPDSQLVFKLPAAATLDSVYAFQLGASNMTAQIYRNRGGTVDSMLDSRPSITSTRTKLTNLINTTSLTQDEGWVCIKSVTGTITQMNFIFYLHGSQ